jgi:hypothetical protein
MANAPNTQAVLNELQMLMQGLQVNSQAAFANVYLGGTKDVKPNLMPLCIIYLLSEDSIHFTLGGGVRDIQTIRIHVACDYTQNQTAAQCEVQIVGIVDALKVLFQQHATLGGTSPVADARPKPSGTARLGFVKVSGNEIARIYEMELQITQQYYVTVGS